MHGTIAIEPSEDADARSMPSASSDFIFLGLAFGCDLHHGLISGAKRLQASVGGSCNRLPIVNDEPMDEARTPGEAIPAGDGDVSTAEHENLETKSMTAEELIRGGNLDDALAAVQADVRKKPADAKLRVLLFQLLAILGQWDRALTQLNVAAELDPLNLLMAQVCRVALQCEALRTDIFAGGTTPMVLGQPPEWLGQLIQANEFAAAGRLADSATLREQAFDAAPAISGKINNEPFAWLADADPRLGPVMEAMVDGKYYWIPLSNIREIQIEAPADLRDLVWISANFTWLNGGTKFGLVPVRYPGSEKSTDSAIRMARKTDWTTAGELSFGLGQRELVTDQKEYAFLEIRSIVLDQPELAVTDAASSEEGAQNG